MSGNAEDRPHRDEPSLDVRARRTREILGDALIELILERSFESITVQQVIDRAGVARSTFYSHYSDKQDLFVSDVDQFLAAFAGHLDRLGEAVDSPGFRVIAVTELLDHVRSARELWSALTASGKLGDVLDLAQAHFARAIESRLARSNRVSPGQRADLPFAARGFAAMLVSLLEDWMRRGGPGDPKAVDELFHRMVWHGIGN